MLNLNLRCRSFSSMVTSNTMPIVALKSPDKFLHRWSAIASRYPCHRMNFSRLRSSPLTAVFLRPERRWTTMKSSFKRTSTEHRRHQRRDWPITRPFILSTTWTTCPKWPRASTMNRTWSITYSTLSSIMIDIAWTCSVAMICTIKVKCPMFICRTISLLRTIFYSLRSSLWNWERRWINDRVFFFM